MFEIFRIPNILVVTGSSRERGSKGVVVPRGLNDKSLEKREDPDETNRIKEPRYTVCQLFSPWTRTLNSVEKGRKTRVPIPRVLRTNP